ncbi:hypothetical protein DPMN_105973 [Dreissena polymorpha]|uniref:Uncharacterized protein n=1 Tax=Dreissena polymorpha TaxID=45954 RepID=A0A9D4QJ87_DREPO|nr:hypothetical protein DPMN_105973 [Dreissena polymorpha]
MMAGAHTGHAVSQTKRRSAMPTSDSSVTTSRRRWVDLGFYTLVPLLRREADNPPSVGTRPDSGTPENIQRSARATFRDLGEVRRR